MSGGECRTFCFILLSGPENRYEKFSRPTKLISITFPMVHSPSHYLYLNLTTPQATLTIESSPNLIMASPNTRAHAALIADLSFSLTTTTDVLIAGNVGDCDELMLQRYTAPLHNNTDEKRRQHSHEMPIQHANPPPPHDHDGPCAPTNTTTTPKKMSPKKAKRVRRHALLREKIIERAKSYLGVPYKQKYWEKGS